MVTVLSASMSTVHTLPVVPAQAPPHAIVSPGR